MCLSFSKDGKYLLSAGRDRMIAVYQRTADPSNPYALLFKKEEAHARAVVSCSWGSSGTDFITVSKEKKAPIKLWSIADNKLEEKLTLKDFECNVTAACYVGDHIVIGLEDGAIMMDGNKKQMSIEYSPNGAINKMASCFHDGCWHLGVGAADHTVRIYKIK